MEFDAESPKFEIIVELSTAHLPEKDRLRLEYDSCALLPSVTVYDYEYGWFIPLYPGWLDDHEDVETHYSPAFLSIVRWCLDHNVRVLRFDADSPVCGTFSVFEE